MKSGKVVIQDATILIDLVNGGILGAWFRLGITTVVTDFILDEVRAGPQQHPTFDHREFWRLFARICHGYPAFAPGFHEKLVAYMAVALLQWSPMAPLFKVERYPACFALIS